MRTLKIGITFRNDQSLHQTWWGSGIGQNLKFYYDLFELMGHEPYMVLNGPVDRFDFNGKSYRTITFDNIVSERFPFDFFLEAGVTISQALREQLLEIGQCKVVGLRCGHQYLAAAEGLFVKNSLPVGQFSRGQSRMWVIPNYAKETAFLSTLHGCPVDVVPYIWEPDFVEKTFISIDRLKQPDIYVLEPNISVQKNSLIPMIILQRLYEKNPNIFDKAYVANSENFCNKDYFLNNFVSNLDVLRAETNKVFFVGRQSINQIFTKPDLLLGYQYDNQLNYLYNEAVYMGLPFVHNSPAYSEVGCHYPEQDVNKGAEQVIKAISGNLRLDEEVIERNNCFLNKFSIHNKEVQKTYKNLIEKIIN